MSWTPDWGAAAARMTEENAKLDVRRAVILFASVTADHMKGKSESGEIDFKALPVFEYVDPLRSMFDSNGHAYEELLSSVTLLLPHGIRVSKITFAEESSAQGDYISYTLTFTISPPTPAN